MTKFQIETYGCSMNKADSEAMAGLLLEASFVEGSGGVLIINTCTVKTPTERKILRRLRSLSGQKVVVSGCLPAASPEIAEIFPEFSFIGMNIEDIVSAVSETDAGKRFVRIGPSSCRIKLPRKRSNPVVEIVPIAQGCLGDCSYCITKRARGCLVSYPIDLIVERIKAAISDGVKEIWLTAQDTGAYGLDTGESLPKLLDVLSSLQGDFRIRVGMMNPSHALALLGDLVEAYADEKIYKFIHLPLQSGDDRILAEMNRGYSVSDFKEIVGCFRKKYPEITVATDVIVGYPSEDEAAYRNTMNLIKEIRPNILNVSRYWARPGTKAAEMRQHPGRVTKQRSRLMDEVFKRIGLEENLKMVGWEGYVLVSEEARGGFCGRTSSYTPVIIHSRQNLLGKFIKVKVTSATYCYLKGVPSS